MLKGMITIETFNIGENIRNERLKQGITQEQLAEMSNLSLNFISTIGRKEKQNISINSLMAIASALNIPSYELLKGANTPPNNRRKKIDLLTHQLYKLPQKISDPLCDSFLLLVRTFKNNK